MEQNLSIFCESLLKFTSERIPLVVVTMTNYRGDVPQDIGARMIVGHEGILYGTIGGGKIENRCLEKALELLNSPTLVPPQSFTWNLQKEIGMSCGGEVTMFFETQRSQEEWRVAIFGAGHISQELTRVLLRLDCHLTVIDSRREWLDKLPESPRLHKIEAIDMKAELDKLSANTYVASMTMGHGTDYPILHKALTEKNFPYLGVIGSPQKRLKLESELKAEGVTRLKDFFCPIGESIGGNAPSEIAISIVAQMLRVRGEVKKV